MRALPQFSDVGPLPLHLLLPSRKAILLHQSSCLREEQAVFNLLMCSEAWEESSVTSTPLCHLSQALLLAAASISPGHRSREDRDQAPGPYQPIRRRFESRRARLNLETSMGDTLLFPSHHLQDNTDSPSPRSEIFSPPPDRERGDLPSRRKMLLPSLKTKIVGTFCIENSSHNNRSRSSASTRLISKFAEFSKDLACSRNLLQ